MSSPESNVQVSNLEENISRRNFFPQSLSYIKYPLCVGGVLTTLFSESSSDLSLEALDHMKNHSNIMRERIKSAVSPTITVRPAMRYDPLTDSRSWNADDSFEVYLAGDSITAGYCFDASTLPFAGLADIVKHEYDGVAIDVTSGGSPPLAEPGADSQRTYENIKAYFKTYPWEEQDQQPIWLTSFGADDILNSETIMQSFLGYNSAKRAIDEIAHNFFYTADQIYGLLLQKRQDKPTINPQVIDLLIPNFTKLESVKQQVDKNTLVLLDYAILSINYIKILLSQKYGFAFVDLYNTDIHNDELCPVDKFHPSEQGYEDMNQLIAKLFVFTSK